MLWSQIQMAFPYLWFVFELNVCIGLTKSAAALLLPIAHPLEQNICLHWIQNCGANGLRVDLPG
jgi:hypothetical protein